MTAGFQHETNTFSRTSAEYENFLNGEGFPALRRNEELFELVDVNIPMGGFLAEMRDTAATIIPVIWAAASPSGPVSRSAYDRIAGEILESAEKTRPDAVYLDLHGAMVAEHHDDGEGELLTRLRSIVGSSVPIVVSLDLHANVSEAMMANADGMVAFRTYPHVDMAETGRRAAQLLTHLYRGGQLHRYWRQIPFLIPVNAGNTLAEPARSIYEEVTLLDRADRCLSFAPGFPAADTPDCGPTVWGYGSDADDLKDAVDELYTHIVARESEFQVSFLTPEEAVAEADRLASRATRPVLIADPQDNPGAGGDARTTGLLSALIRADAQGAAVASICDPAAAAAAHSAGLGASITLQLGGHPGIPETGPLEATFVVEYLSDGKCRFEGPMMNGNEIDSGPSASLRHRGILIGVTTHKSQIMDRAQLRMIGIHPEKLRIVVVKSAIHFRADFDQIAETVLNARAPGPMTAEPADLPWHRLRCGIRITALGPAFEGIN
ncbi:M81 family metallopeptidase [Rhodococcus erythropolis]